MNATIAGLTTRTFSPLCEYVFALTGPLAAEIFASGAAGLTFTGDYLPTSSFVTVTAVPEPTTLVLVAAAAGLAAILRRRLPARQSSRRLAAASERG